MLAVRDGPTLLFETTADWIAGDLAMIPPEQLACARCRWG
jgi:hypothetical protein